MKGKKLASVYSKILLFVGAFSAFFSLDIYNLQQEKQTQNRSLFQGVLNLWLVSSYESGTASKKMFLALR